MAKEKEMVPGKETQGTAKQVTKGGRLFDAGCLMLIFVVDARADTDSEVVFLGKERLTSCRTSPSSK